MAIVQHTLTDAAGSPVRGRTVSCELVGGGFVTADRSEIVRPDYAETDADGAYSFDLAANSAIDPAGTHYKVQHPGGDTLAFVVPDGAGPFWLRDLLVTDPDTPGQVVQGLPPLAGADDGDVVTVQSGVAAWAPPPTAAPPTFTDNANGTTTITWS